MVGRTDTPNSDADSRGWGVHAGECVRVCACMRDVFAIYDNNILPRLIMIIIINIFQYFIEIAQTDDFHSTGAVYYT